MTRAHRRTQVAVVGAGPAGAALSLLLASRGIAVTLVERQEDFAREFRGEVVLPSGSAVLRQLGIDEALAGVPSRAPEEIRASFERRSFLQAAVDAEWVGGTLPLAISQPALLETLVEEAGRHPTFEFLRGASVKGVVSEARRVVGVRTIDAGSEFTLRADLVIGTDGRGSAVRRSAGFALQAQDLPMDIVWCKIPPLPQDEGRAVVRVFAGAGFLLIAYVSHDDLLQVAWVIAKGTFGELRRRGIEAWVESMAEHVDEVLAAHLRLHKDAARHPFLLSTASDHVERWWRPGVLLLGDAAHTMSPVGAQGINVALRDTVVAANQLVPVLLGSGDAAGLDRACAAIEAARAPEIREIQRLQALPPRMLFGQGTLAKTARRVVPWLLRSPLASRIAPRFASVFLEGSEDLRLEV